MNGPVVNVGLVGYGLGGRVFHAPVLTSVDGFRLCKVYETRPENIANLKKRYKDVQIVSNVDEIINDKEIQLVVLATPNLVHYDQAKRALQNGKHVVVEKPFTVNTDEADELIDIAKRCGKILTVHHNRRWDSDFLTIEKVVKSGMLGEIVEYEAHYDRYRPNKKDNWREKNTPGSGMHFDLGSHLIDQAQCLFGLPDEILGIMGVQRQASETIDFFEIILAYPGLKVTLKSSVMVRELGPHFIINGRKGSFIKYGLDVQEEALGREILPNEDKNWGKETEEVWGKINTEVNGVHLIGKVESEAGDYREFYRNLYNAFNGEAELAVTPEQARNTIRILELSELSNVQKKWVKFE